MKAKKSRFDSKIKDVKIVSNYIEKWIKKGTYRISFLPTGSGLSYHEENINELVKKEGYSTEEISALLSEVYYLIVANLRGETDTLIRDYSKKQQKKAKILKEKCKLVKEMFVDREMKYKYIRGLFAKNKLYDSLFWEVGKKLADKDDPTIELPFANLNIVLFDSNQREGDKRVTLNFECGLSDIKDLIRELRDVEKAISKIRK